MRASNEKHPLSRRLILGLLTLTMLVSPAACREGTKGRDAAEIGVFGCIALIFLGHEATKKSEAEQEKSATCPICSGNERCNIYHTPPTCMAPVGTLGVECGFQRFKPAGAPDLDYPCADGLQCRGYTQDTAQRCSLVDRKRSKQGGKCAWTPDCEGDLVCNRTANSFGTCGAKLNVGASCMHSDECVAGLKCSREYKDENRGVCKNP